VRGSRRESERERKEKQAHQQHFILKFRAFLGQVHRGREKERERERERGRERERERGGRRRGGGEKM